MKSELCRIQHELQALKKIKQNKPLSYLVFNIIEVLEVYQEEEEEIEGANVDIDSQRKGERNVFKK